MPSVKAQAKPRRFKRFLFGGTLLILSSVVVLLLIEGAANVWGFAVAFWDVREPLAERSHTDYDELLGWSNIPSTHIEDLYGPGRDLTINSQGFRGVDGDYTAEVPAGRKRIMCVGDSFTLGYGVGDEDTWCHQLGVLDPKLETINMGQGGYGLGQAYLWYRRDGVAFDHDVLVFSFITPGFRRMRMTKFVGYPKPRVRLVDGELETENVPVPTAGLRSPRMAQWTQAFNELATYRAARRVLGSSERVAGLDERTARATAIAIFEDLARMAAAKNSLLVLVYFPMPEDWASPESDLLRYFLAAECKARGLLFVDVVEELRRLPRDEAAAMFEWHFSPAGNRFAAEYLQSVLSSHLR